MPQKTKKWLSKIKAHNNLYDKAIISATAGFTINIAYALYHGIMGAASHSVWLLLLGAYYIILSVMRFSAVLYYRNIKSSKNSFSELFLLNFLGWMLILTSVILGFSVYLSYRFDTAVKYHEITMISIAAYTFYKITLTIINIVKAKKYNSLLLIAIRNIGCADAAASLLSLQRSMIVSFDGMSKQESELMNLLTGIGVCIFTLSLGFYMITIKKHTKY